MPVSRRKKIINTPLPSSPSSPISDLKSCYCRKCMRNKPAKDFYEATDLLLDSNGKMSVCKSCIDIMYNNFYSAEPFLPKSIYKLCKILNVVYSDEAIQMIEGELQKKEENGHILSSVFGSYKAKLGFLKARSRIGDLYFVDSNSGSRIISDPLDENHKDLNYLQEFWGATFGEEDYTFLEKELAGLKNTHKIDSYAEESLAKYICLKQLEIRKYQNDNRGQVKATSVQDLQKLMSSLAISPDKAKMIDEGKHLDTFGMWIKDIEENEPAQFYDFEKEKYGMFRDVENVDSYFQKYFVRPLRNAILQSKDFNIDDELDNFNEEFNIPSLDEGDNDNAKTIST
jgi:hypothetical protein